MRIRIVVPNVNMDRVVEVDGHIDLRRLISKLGLNPVEYIPIVNGKVVTYEYQVGNEDEIKLIPVVSGG